jgi:regulator of protease activity HflC (stomatin/prohibitin superfamily)
MNQKIIIAAVLLVIIVILLAGSVFTVDETEQAIVTQLGKRKSLPATRNTLLLTIMHAGE